MRRRDSWLGLFFVLFLHGGAIAAVFWLPSPKNNVLVMPTIQGVIIPAPPAEAVQIPSASKAPPPQKEVEPPPKPLPKPKPKPKPKPLPKPKQKLPPLPKAPPSEKAIRREDQAEEPQSPPPPVQKTVKRAEEDNKALGAPITPPRHDANPLNNPAPAYPTISRRLKEEGIVILELLILPDGKVGEVRVKKSSGFKRLDKTAMKAVKRWRYLPAKRGDEAISYWYLQPLEFSLNQ
ncbi:energy transducer TonB [Zhongshania aquimaris]|uniref:TonB family protein n=1 Tax=Zhongshania aquimaris TaxID=2857107 RepID=A0ABS6VPH2_9GAMM|nr:energy transducer TonB [Zhongshania aquimaris]MBW2939959.1 TonB family protein [Zhongshania aquimaris]